MVSTTTTVSEAIWVYERIDDLVISGNNSVLAPPGTGVFQVTAGADQLPLENIVCVWNMGTNYGYETEDVAMLNATTPLEKTFNYVEADVGTQTVSVNCSNAVSNQNVTMDIEVIWDNVTIANLTCDSSPLWNYSMTCEMTIVRFGTGACFEWDMGDGEPVVYYRDGYCVVPVIAASPTYVQVGLN